MTARPRTGAAYFGNRHAAHAARDLDRLAECCDYVVHTFSETDFFYHKAAVEKIFALTRKKGLEVWADPWGLGGAFGGESFSKFLLDHPTEWQEYSDGRRAPAACLNSRAFRDFVLEWLLTAREAGAQVVFWDEPHVSFNWAREWEGVYACACRVCRALYRDRFGGPMSAKLDGPARDFRRWTIESFLEEVMGFARKKKLRNALCLYAFEGYGDYDALWKDLAALPALDVFGCDPYWRWDAAKWKSLLSPKSRRLKTPGDYVGYFAEKVLRETRRHGKDSQIWIQSMRLPKGREKEIAGAVRAAADAGVTHLAAWSYDGGALLDPVLAEDPPKVWEETAKAFAGLREP